MTEPTQDLAARRREIVRAVADLSEKHDVPMPIQIDVSRAASNPEKTIAILRLDANSADAVAAWADVLFTGTVTCTPTPRVEPTFLAVQSEGWDCAGPIWLDVRHLAIWSACDLPEGGAS